MLQRMTEAQQRMLDLADYLEALPPERFDMSSFLRRDKNSADVRMIEALDGCGTIGCVAGHTLLRFPEEARRAEEQLRLSGSAAGLGIDDVAAVVLGLSEGQLRELFIPNVPYGSEFSFYGDFWDSVTSGQAAVVLRHLALTGEIDWSLRDGG